MSSTSCYRFRRTTHAAYFWRYYRTVFVTLLFVFLLKLFIFIFILLLAKSIFKRQRVLRTVCVCALFGKYFFSKTTFKPSYSCQITVLEQASIAQLRLKRKPFQTERNADILQTAVLIMYFIHFPSLASCIQLLENEF